MWSIVHQNNCELGFYDQGGAGELTIPVGTHIIWVQGTEEGKFPRPEMDFKDRQTQSEVYEGRYSASGSYRFARGRYFLVTDRIYVDPSKLVKGSCAYMQVFDGGAGGGRLGIVNGDGPWADPGARSKDPSEGDVSTQWGQWLGTYAPALPNRKWEILKTPAIQPLEGFVRLVMQFNVDFAGKSTAGHWDSIVLEQVWEDEPPPEETDYELMVEACLEALEIVAARIMGG